MDPTTNDTTLFRNAIRTFIGAGALTAGGIFGVHLLEPDPHFLDLIVPPLLALTFSALFVGTFIRDEWLIPIMIAAITTPIIAFAFTTWYFVLDTHRDSTKVLIDTLPPIPIVLVALTPLSILLLRPRTAFAVTLVGWTAISMPIFGYFVLHPDEALTKRGQDILLALGPFMTVTLVLIPFFERLQGMVAALYKERDELQTLSELDPLTKLHNRRAGERILEQVLADKETTGVLLLDVDRFKNINDTYGHPAGDEVLRAIAGRCRQALRKEDGFSRWGGEEFLVIVRNVDDAGLKRIGELLRTAINGEPIEPVGTVTASFGATKARPDDTFESIVARADQALYTAKESGRDRVVYV